MLADARWFPGQPVNQSRVAEQLGVHRSNVSRAIVKIAERLRALGLHDLVDDAGLSLARDRRSRLWYD